MRLRKLLILSLIIPSLFPQTLKAEEKLDILKLPPTEVYNAYRNYREHLDYLYLLKEVPISTVPKILPLKTQMINLHPAFITQFVLPPDTKVVKSYTSLPVKFFKVVENTILIQPSKQASQGNLVVYYQEKGKPKTLTVLLKVYDPTNSHREPLHTQFVFTQGKVLSPAEVLDRYYSLYKHYPQRPYEFFRVDGIVYLIQRSSLYGTTKGGKYKYLVIPTVMSQ